MDIVPTRTSCPFFVAGDYHSIIFDPFSLGFIDDVGLVDTRNGLVGRDLNDIELVDRLKFLRLGDGRTGHAGELIVKSEVVLERDGRKRFVLALNINVFLCLDRLMQTLAVAAWRQCGR